MASIGWRNEELTNPIVDGIIKNKGAESMKQYQFLLFDADGTLLDFDRCEEKALRDTLLSFGIPDCQETLRSYHQINAALWERFNAGEIDRPYLLHRRFEQLCEQLGRQDDPALMNRYYMEQLSRHADLLEEAEEICNILYKKYKLYIITNGSSLTQHGRFAICPLTPLFQNIFISEDMGVKKPQKAYFDAVAAAIPGFDPQRPAPASHDFSPCGPWRKIPLRRTPPSRRFPHRYEVPPQRTTAAGPPAPAPPVHPPAERAGPPPGYFGWG